MLYDIGEPRWPMLSTTFAFQECWAENGMRWKVTAATSTMLIDRGRVEIFLLIHCSICSHACDHQRSNYINAILLKDVVATVIQACHISKAINPKHACTVPNAYPNRSKQQTFIAKVPQPFASAHPACHTISNLSESQHPHSVCSQAPSA